MYEEGRHDVEENREILRWALPRAYEMLALVLEAGGLAGTRTRLIEQWKKFENKDLGLTVSGPDWVESEPLAYIDTILRGLRGTVGEGLTSAEAYDLARLERILRETAMLVRRREIIPKGELDVQAVMHDYLAAFFTEYTRNIAIPKVIKTFKPDGGVPDLKAAIEFKYAASETELREALSGIYEDMAGYSGSADWTRFYSVLYQTEPFVSDNRFNKAISRGGSHSWTSIVVTGSGKREAKNVKKENSVQIAVVEPAKPTSTCPPCFKKGPI